MVRTMSAAEFKAHCLELMDTVASSGRPIIVTKRGKPVAQLGPVIAKPKTLFGYRRGRVQILGDIIAPIGVAWKADRR
jgi:prevent-host-death family protein